MACITPFIVTMKVTNQKVPVPCGKCPECMKRRISGWSFRLMQEGKRASSAFFITLTYDTKHVPITRNGFMEVRKEDVQKFFKRLRKAQQKLGDGQPIKYYLAAEYGGQTKRPHYHAIIFNAKVELLQPCWPLGMVHYGNVTGASIGYTLKYMCKPNKIPMHRNDDRTPEFALMSKGIGENYLTDNMVKWHKNDLDNRMHCVLTDGRKIAMPRYFKDKIYSEHERKRIAFMSFLEAKQEDKEIRAELGEEYEREMLARHKAAFNKMYKDSGKERNKI